MNDVFISYAREDKAFVKRLAEALSKRGREAWVDWKGIPPSAKFMQEIFHAIEGADAFIFVLTPNSAVSKVCRDEIDHAVAQNKRMIRIEAGEVDAARVPEPLRNLSWISFRDSDVFETAADTLIKALDIDLDWIRMHTRLLTQAVRWEEGGRNNRFALPGEFLREAEQWLADACTKKERQPTALQTEYIIASRKASEQWLTDACTKKELQPTALQTEYIIVSRKASARRQRFTLGAVAAGAVIAIVLVIIARTQLDAARRTSAQADFDLAVMYEREADLAEPKALAHLARSLRTRPDAPAARRYLVSLLRDRLWYLPATEPLRHQGTVVEATFSPDVVTVLTASTDNAARLWDVKTGLPIGEPMDLNARLPDWVLDLAEAIGGERLDEEGRTVPPEKSVFTLRKEIEASAAKRDNFWTRLGQWFFLRGPQRTVSPDSRVSVTELDRLRAK
jgi:hypothetical protein